MRLEHVVLVDCLDPGSFQSELLSGAGWALVEAFDHGFHSTVKERQYTISKRGNSCQVLPGEEFERTPNSFGAHIEIHGWLILRTLS